jgi:hypothetical protein
MSTSPGSGGCAKPALLTGLNYAGVSTVDVRSLVYLSDGFTLCGATDPTVYQQDTLGEVRARNTGNVPINVFGVGTAGSMDEDFLRRLAAQNGGTYSRIVN